MDVKKVKTRYHFTYDISQLKGYVSVLNRYFQIFMFNSVTMEYEINFNVFKQINLFFNLLN